MRTLLGSFCSRLELRCRSERSEHVPGWHVVWSNNSVKPLVWGPRVRLVPKPHQHLEAGKEEKESTRDSEGKRKKGHAGPRSCGRGACSREPTRVHADYGMERSGGGPVGGLAAEGRMKRGEMTLGFLDLDLWGQQGIQS